jgi:alpha-glucosidase
VHRQAADPDSVLNFYRSLLRVRRASGALVSGQFQALDSPAGVLAYARTNRSDELIVVLNFTDRIQDAILPAAASGRSTVVFGSHRRATRLSRVAFTRSSR